MIDLLLRLGWTYTSSEDLETKRYHSGLGQQHFNNPKKKYFTQI